MTKHESAARGGSALTVALIGAFVTAFGYLGTYYKDLAIQEKKQKHDFVIALLREDPRDSSANLLWASKAELLELSDVTITNLEESPFDGPTRSEANDTDNFESTEEVISSGLTALVRGLDSPVKSTRWKSLETLEIQFSSDVDAVAAVTANLSDSNLKAMTPNGLYNHLYFLNNVEWTGMGAETKGGVRDVLENIKARKNEGILAVGPKTTELIEGIEVQLR